MKKYAIIVAGGSGTRMNTSVPKQFIPVNGLPVIMHTIQRFIDYPEKIEIILVLPKDQINDWETLCSQYSFSSPIHITTGGSTRFQSVKNGLNLIPDNDESLIAIHDGVRPFVTQKIIRETFNMAQEKGNAITAISLKDSIRSITEKDSKAEDRTKFKIIQTPQTFKASLIKSAFETTDNPLFTDDASVLEAKGEKIFLSEGSYQNIKITTPEDLIVAEALFKTFSYND